MSCAANALGGVGTPCPPKRGYTEHTLLLCGGGHGVPSLRTVPPL